MIAEQAGFGMTRPEGVSPGRIAVPTYEDYQRWGDTAYALAREREASLGRIDEDTAALYEEASYDLNHVAWSIPGSKAEDPVNLLKIADSLDKQAAVAGHDFYDDGSLFIDKKSNLKDMASKTLERAAVVFMGEDSGAAGALAGEFTGVNPPEAVAKSLVEAARATAGRQGSEVENLGSETVHELEAAGQDVVLEFMHRHEEDDGFVPMAAELAIEKLTDTHKLPAQEQPGALAA